MRAELRDFWHWFIVDFVAWDKSCLFDKFLYVALTLAIAVTVAGLLFLITTLLGILLA